jgi:hypothetical protein
VRTKLAAVEKLEGMLSNRDQGSSEANVESKAEDK